MESPLRRGGRSGGRGHWFVGRRRVGIAVVGKALEIEALAGAALAGGV